MLKNSYQFVKRPRKVKAKQFEYESDVDQEVLPSLEEKVDEPIIDDVVPEFVEHEHQVVQPYVHPEMSVPEIKFQQEINMKGNKIKQNIGSKR